MACFSKAAKRNRNAQLTQYTEWLNSHNAGMSNVAIVEDDVGGMRVVATKPVPRGNPVLTVPRELGITPTRLLKNQVQEALDVVAVGCEANETMLLCWLMRQRFFPNAGESKMASTSAAASFCEGTRSRDDGGPCLDWQPYISHLPRDFHDPLQWTEEERANLKGTNLVGSLPALEALVREQYDAVVPRLVHHFPKRWPAKEVKYSRWLWAHSALVSRALPRRLLPDDADQSTQPSKKRRMDGGEGEPSLVEKCKEESLLLPLLDSTNHKRNTKVTWLSTDQGVSLQYDERDLEIGDEVYNNYGAKEDEELLLCYGFVDGVSSYPIRLAGSADRILITPKDPLPEVLLTCLKRLMGANLDDPEEQEDDNLGIAVMEVIKDMLSTRLRPLTMPVPEKGHAWRVKCANTYRAGQKKSVSKALSACRKRLRRHEKNLLQQEKSLIGSGETSHTTAEEQQSTESTPLVREENEQMGEETLQANDEGLRLREETLQAREETAQARKETRQVMEETVEIVDGTQGSTTGLTGEQKEKSSDELMISSKAERQK